ncbi:unnamed protein product [Blepharisma stoltei]|uniref:Uncharacterized protein n=1 Tax=Blepharisma stoltei TaxID=1481888 RepID=A0AAU9ILR1_9CILI|nr:unnamed protein product [Blepharisma stoltei]
MNDQEIMALPPEERLKLYVEQLQESRRKHQQEKEEAKAKKIEEKKREKFLKKQKEDKFTINPKSRPVFKLGERCTPEAFDNKTATYLPRSDLTATELYHTAHFIPRSYKYPEVPFRLTCNNGDEFGHPKSSLLTNSGKQLVQTNIAKFEKEVEHRREEEMKPKIVHFGPRWEPSKTHGGSFSVPPTDDYHLYAQNIKPKYFQSKPMLRTSRYGGLFSYP